MKVSPRHRPPLTPGNISGTRFSCGPGSSVGVATDYGLDGPGSNTGGEEIFCPSRPALGPIQPPVQWVSRVKCGRGVLLTTHPLLVPRSWKSRVIPPGHTGLVMGSLYLYLYSFLLKAESTPEPQCGRKDYVNKKSKWT